MARRACNQNLDTVLPRPPGTEGLPKDCAKSPRSLPEELRHGIPRPERGDRLRFPATGTASNAAGTDPICGSVPKAKSGIPESKPLAGGRQP